MKFFQCSTIRADEERFAWLLNTLEDMVSQVPKIPPAKGMAMQMKYKVIAIMYLKYDVLSIVRNRYLS